MPIWYHCGLQGTEQQCKAQSGPLQALSTTRLYTYDAKAATNHMYIMGYTKAAFMYAEISIS